MDNAQRLRSGFLDFSVDSSACEACLGLLTLLGDFLDDTCVSQRIMLSFSESTEKLSSI